MTQPAASPRRRLALSPTLGLGTRGILVLLAAALLVQGLAVAVFVWDRSQRVNPAFQRLIAGQVSAAIERLDEAEGPARLRLARRLAPRGLVMLPEELLPVGAVQPASGALNRSDFAALARLVEQRLAAQGQDAIQLDVVFLASSDLPQRYFEALLDRPPGFRPNSAPLAPFGQTPQGPFPSGQRPFDQAQQGLRPDPSLRPDPNLHAAPRQDFVQRMIQRHNRAHENDLDHPPLPHWLEALIEQQQPVSALAVRLSDTSQVYLLLHFENSAPGLALAPLLLIGLFAFLPLLLAFLALMKLRQSTLGLGAAARRFGEDLDAPEVQISGPKEVTQTVEAFNAMQERIRGLVGQRTRMLAAISHDLRTQLTKLRLRAEFIEPESQRDKAVRDIERLDSLLGQVVQFARMDAGLATPEPASRFDLTPLLRGLHEDMDWGARLELSLPDSLALHQQRSNLERVILNLVENALRYGERASLTVAPLGDQRLRLILDDQGPGIPEAELTKVFEPFYRLESSRNLATGGSGLGLAIVKGLVELMGGSLALSNREQGGLRVTLDLPLESPAWDADGSTAA